MTNRLSRRNLIAVAGANTLLAAVPRALAQARDPYPSRPIRMLNSSPPGSTFDAIIRAACMEAEKKLGQPFVMDYRPGVPAFIGARNAAPDGYTLVVLSLSTIRQPIQQPVGYDAIKDFTWIASLAEINFGVLVPADSPIRSWAELLAWAKANPRTVSYGCPSGLGNSSHIFGAEIAAREKADWIAVPYKGSNDCMVALLSGQITFSIDTTLSASAQVKAGKVRVLAVATAERLKPFPNVPTTRELGYDVLIESPLGIGGPAGMNPAVVRVVQDAFKFSVDQQGFQAVLDQGALRPWYMGAGDFMRFAQRADSEQRALMGKYGFARN
jgi:tripartite-type tricarboxylate transporter receptor subunit TctC